MSSPNATSRSEETPVPCLKTEQIDGALADIEEQIDWLRVVSPTGNEPRWKAFGASNYRAMPELTYRPLEIDIAATRERLAELPLDEVQHSSIESLLREKKRELERLLDLVSLRGEEGFVAASIACFGAPKPGLLSLAQDILDRVQPEPEPERDAGAAEIVEAAERARESYREMAPDFDFPIHIDEDTNSMLMVSNGELYVNPAVRIPRARVEALIAHELGTHVVTRYNGSHQPIRQMATGLAHYDALQEGLATLGEVLVGGLSASRLRVLAARVLAVDLAVQGTTVEALFTCLHEEWRMPLHEAFDIATRAKAGGGLTKDACYLEGLADLLDHLARGADLAPLFMGKFALQHLPILEGLVDEGFLRPPVIVPSHVDSARGRARLEAARHETVHQLITGADTTP